MRRYQRRLWEGVSAGARLVEEPRRRRVESALVWMFGSPRTGSTWLFEMLTHPLIHRWNEPYAGFFLGVDINQGDPETGYQIRLVDEGSDRIIPDNLFRADRREEWVPAVRRFVIDIIGARFDPRPPERILIKEPNGSQGADILLRALKGSSMILLVRDPRDVIDSLMDLHRPDSWNPRGALNTTEDRLGQIGEYCRQWKETMGIAEKAFGAHPEPQRLLVRYEDLLTDTFKEMRRVYDFMAVGAGDEHVAQQVERCSLDNVPAEEKGPGKFIRKATPGHWREAFSEEEQALINRRLEAWIRSFGYA